MVTLGQISASQSFIFVFLFLFPSILSLSSFSTTTFSTIYFCQLINIKHFFQTYLEVHLSVFQMLHKMEFLGSFCRFLVANVFVLICFAVSAVISLFLFGNLED